MRYLVFDIETIPCQELIREYEEFLLDSAQKDPENKNPFPPIWGHQVLTIGVLGLNRDYVPEFFYCLEEGCSAGASERNILQSFVRLVKEDRATSLVDWNGRAFDLPVIQTRCLRYGMNMPWFGYRHRYTSLHIDLADIWINYGAFQKPGLQHLTKLMGLPGKFEVDGSQVREMYEANELQQIDQYCLQDVSQTAFLFLRMQLLVGKITEAVYTECVTRLLNFCAPKLSRDFQKAFDITLLLPHN